MYRRPKFLEVLHEIREEMSREADYDVDLFAELARTGEFKGQKLEAENEKMMTIETVVDLAAVENQKSKIKN